MKFNATAILLISGPTAPNIESEIKGVLSEYSLSLNDIQKIDMAGRLILGIEISLDKAHFGAIEQETSALCSKAGFDFAMELV